MADWSSWQKERGEPFEALKQVLKRLTSTDQHSGLAPGEIGRRAIDDVRDIPSIRMAYGDDVLLVHASAAVKRICALAYLLVWAWREHLLTSKLRGMQPDKRLVLLVDEVESHLHPKWQRVIVPALLEAVNALHPSMNVQIIAATHSPLVMGSLEAHWDEETDVWLDLDLTRDGSVSLQHRAFEKMGDASRWLVSDAFDLAVPGSLEREAAMNRLTALGKKFANQEVPNEKEFSEAKDALLAAVGAGDDLWGVFSTLEERAGKSN
jgi:hypothetical protein